MSFYALFKKIEGMGFDSESFCKACGFSRRTFSERLSGESDFNLEEIQRMIDVLKLTEEEAKEIFFIGSATT